MRLRPADPTRRALLRAAVAVAFAGLASPAAAAAPPEVSLDEARAAHQAGGVTLIDIREPDEHATGVAAGARLLPMSQLPQRLAEIPQDPDRPVLLICRTQNRSGSVVDALRKRGYTNVRFVRGGMKEWAERGWPMVAPEAGPR